MFWHPEPQRWFEISCFMIYVVSVAWFQLIYYIIIYDYVVLSPKHQLNNFWLFIPGCSGCHAMFPPSDVLSIRDLYSALLSGLFLFFFSSPRLQAQQIQLLFQLHFVEDWRRSYQGVRWAVTSLDLGNGWTWKMQEVLDLLELRETLRFSFAII